MAGSVMPSGSSGHSVATASYMRRSALRPRGESKLASERSSPEAARRSPRVRAPSDCRRRATAEAKRASPPTVVTHSLYSGAETWLERWLRPSCWMALSADQGSSMVRWTRRRWLATAAEAWSEMPVEAASETMATSFLP